MLPLLNPNDRKHNGLPDLGFKVGGCEDLSNWCRQRSRKFRPSSIQGLTVF